MHNRKRDAAGEPHIAMDRAGIMVEGSAIVNYLNLQRANSPPPHAVIL